MAANERSDRLDRAIDERLRATLATIAPGTELRDALERILRDARADDRILPVEWIGRDRIADYVRRF